MSQVWKDGRSPKVTCSARTISGNPCKRPPIKGTNVCRAHGGAAPQVRAKAAVRIMMSADAAAAKLIEMIHSKKVDDRTKLLAVKDLLDRANLAGTQNIEIGVTPKRTFEDFVGDALVDMGELEATPERDPNIEDAEVVEDDEYDEPPLLNRHDRAAFAEVERARADERRSPRRRRTASEIERLRSGEPEPEVRDTRTHDEILADQQDEQDAILRRVRGQTGGYAGKARTSEARISRG